MMNYHAFGRIWQICVFPYRAANRENLKSGVQEEEKGEGTRNMDHKLC